MYTRNTAISLFCMREPLAGERQQNGRIRDRAKKADDGRALPGPGCIVLEFGIVDRRLVQ
jgi:hypothetical protein